MQLPRHLAKALILCVGIAAPISAHAKPNRDRNDQDRRGNRDKPNERDHRNAPVVQPPTAAPPAAPRETWQPRRGQVWVAGQWQWRDNQWEWNTGRFDQRKKNKEWNDGRWETRQQGGVKTTSVDQHR